MALEVHLVLLDPADVQLLARGATLELAGEVLLVVANDPANKPLADYRMVTFFSFLALCLPSNQPRSAHTLGTLGDEELASGLDGLVDIVTFGSTVGQIVVSNVIKAVLLEELAGNNPRAVFDDLVNPLAVTDGLGALLGRHDSQTLAEVRLVISSDTYDKSGVGEGLLGLLKLAHVSSGYSQHMSVYFGSEPVGKGKALYSPKMEHVKDTIGVDTDSPVCGGGVGPEADGVDELERRRRHLVLASGTSAAAAHALLHINAVVLGAIARLVRIRLLLVDAGSSRVGPLPLRIRASFSIVGDGAAGVGAAGLDVVAGNILCGGLGGERVGTSSLALRALG